jgi:Protein of unknown function (DUF992)
MRLTKAWSRRYMTICLATMVVAAVLATSAANAQSRRVQVGTLTCSLSSGIGLVIGSQRNVSCLFRGTSGEADENAVGPEPDRLKPDDRKPQPSQARAFSLALEGSMLP